MNGDNPRLEPIFRPGTVVSLVTSARPSTEFRGRIARMEPEGVLLDGVRWKQTREQGKEDLLSWLLRGSGIGISEHPSVQPEGESKHRVFFPMAQLLILEELPEAEAGDGA